MEIKIEKAVKVTLTMDSEEALWLKSLMQNPLDTSDSDSDIRKRFWDILNNKAIT